jgi:hypothetical protein
MTPALGVGVCTLRVEPRDDYLVYTVTTYRNLDATLHSATPDSKATYTDARLALAAAGRFLRSFALNSAISP